MVAASSNSPLGAAASGAAATHRPQAVQAPTGALVPAAAIVKREGHAAVFLVEGDKAVQRSVTPSDVGQGDLRLLPGGVQAGDTVVVSPPADLKDGSRITPAKPKE